MAEHREQVDKHMMQQINRRVLMPLLIDLGARYLVKPRTLADMTTRRSRRGGGSATSGMATSGIAPR